jgi:hypothetical protein
VRKKAFELHPQPLTEPVKSLLNILKRRTLKNSTFPKLTKTWVLLMQYRLFQKKLVPVYKNQSPKVEGAVRPATQEDRSRFA